MVIHHPDRDAVIVSVRCDGRPLLTYDVAGHAVLRHHPGDGVADIVVAALRNALAALEPR